MTMTTDMICFLYKHHTAPTHATLIASVTKSKESLMSRKGYGHHIWTIRLLRDTSE